MRLFAFSRDAETSILDFTRTHFTILAPLNPLLQFQQCQVQQWCRLTMPSRIEPMKKIAPVAAAASRAILDYFRAQKLLSSGVVEGLNSKAKVTMRKSYGFRTFRVLKLALGHSLGKLPEPEFTHDFF
jgi:transposase